MGGARIDEKLQQAEKNIERRCREGSSKYTPMLRSGSWADKGFKRPFMEDEHTCIDDIADHLNDPQFQSMAFYGVYDGHDGSDAAKYIKDNLLNLILHGVDFSDGGIEKAMKNAFFKADSRLAEADMSSGTTAIVAIVLGNLLVVANVGDCRAVLGKRGGRVLEMSIDHKAISSAERLRIESLGGFVDDRGYLSGELEVSRALGDFHLQASVSSLLSAEPEVQKVELNEEDEFLIIACDGLWDVVSSGSAVEIARRELMSSNDPERCCKALVTEARNSLSGDNLTVVVVCFSSGPPQKKLFSNSRLPGSTNTLPPSGL